MAEGGSSYPSYPSYPSYQTSAVHSRSVQLASFDACFMFLGKKESLICPDAFLMTLLNFDALVRTLWDCVHSTCAARGEGGLGLAHVCKLKA